MVNQLNHLLAMATTQVEPPSSKDVEHHSHATPKDIDDINAEAIIAREAEHSLSFREAIALYPAAVGWSLFFSLGVIM